VPPPPINSEGYSEKRSEWLPDHRCICANRAVCSVLHDRQLWDLFPRRSGRACRRKFQRRWKYPLPEGTGSYAGSI